MGVLRGQGMLRRWCSHQSGELPSRVAGNPLPSHKGDGVTPPLSDWLFWSAQNGSRAGAEETAHQLLHRAGEPSAH